MAKRAINPSDSFDICLERIYQITNTSTQTELAKVLGISQGNVSSAKKAQTIPASWIVKLFFLGFNPDYILLGIGPQQINRHNFPEIGSSK